MRKKALPVGISDFKTLIEKNYYYFDKTKLIEELLIKKSGVTLFTRPRRFGKTLNMSMLKYFFDMENKDENQKLFKNLYISKSRFFQHQGQNPVIFLSFKDIKASSWDECNKELRNLISELYKDNKYLIKNIDKYDLKEFEDICFKVEESDWKNSLKKLSKFLYEYYGKKL